MYSSLNKIEELSTLNKGLDPYLEAVIPYHREGLHNLTNIYEAYFGKNDHFVQAESFVQNIKDILDKYPSTHMIKNLDYAEIYKEAKKLEEVFQEVFGVSKMFINIMSANFSNAFTYSVTGSWTEVVPKKLTLYNGKYGIQFNPAYKVNLNMTVTMPLIKICSPQEVVAIMIHEMGHNLNKNRTILDKIILLPNTIMTGWLSALINSNTIVDANRVVRDQFIEKMEDEYSEDKPKKEGLVKKVFDNLGSMKNFGKSTFGFAFAMLKNIPIYKEEKYSDSLAATYGYGKEIVTGLKKLYPGYAALNEYGPFMTLMTALGMFLDPHPERIERAKVVQQYLKFELANNKNLTKNEKEKLEADVKSIDEIIKIDFTKYGAGNIGYRQKLDMMFGVTDLRELFFKTDFEKIDKKTRGFDKLAESSMDLLNEVFYDDNKHLIKVKELFKEMIDYVNDKKYTLDNMSKNMTKKDMDFIISKFNLVEEEFKTLFGLREMHTELLFDGLGAVATISVQSTVAIYGKKLKVYDGEYAVKFNPAAGVNILMFFGLENLLLMNERELTSVFIHEFGHNLNRTQTLPAKFWMRVPTLVMLLTSLFLMDSTVDSLKSYRNEELSDELKKLDDSKGFKSLMKELSDKFVLDPLVRFFLKNNEYREEKFSDAFAAMFGYGADVQTALQKFDAYFTKKFGAGMRNKTYNRFQTFVEMFKQLSDPHPERVARVRSNISYIEYELKQNGSKMSKSAKEVLEADLKVLKEIEKLDTTKGGVGNVALRQAIMKVTGGAVDIRELFIKDRYNKIDKKMSNFDKLQESTISPLIEDLYIEGSKMDYGRSVLSEAALKEVLDVYNECLDSYSV